MARCMTWVEWVFLAFKVAWTLTWEKRLLLDFSILVIQVIFIAWRSLFNLFEESMSWSFLLPIIYQDSFLSLGIELQRLFKNHSRLPKLEITGSNLSRACKIQSLPRVIFRLLLHLKYFLWYITVVYLIWKIFIFKIQKLHLSIFGLHRNFGIIFLSLVASVCDIGLINTFDCFELLFPGLWSLILIVISELFSCFLERAFLSRHI